MPETKKNPHTCHTFNHRDEKLEIFKNNYLDLYYLKSQKRLAKLSDGTRMKAKLGIIYGEEKNCLIKFLKDVVKIELSNKKSMFTEIPDTVLFKLIEKHTTKEFNPRNFLSDGYNNSKNGKSSTYGGFLFFGEHNIASAQKLLDMIN